MKFKLPRFRNRKPHRKLNVTVSGKWYLLLTIGLGVVAMSSGNNLLYLIESLLLSALILSGILSELAISNIRFQSVHKPISAKTNGSDLIKIKNTGSLSIFCIEIGEWKNYEFKPFIFIPQIDGKSSITLKVGRDFEKRGWHDWEGIGIGTRFPFGFARKIRFIHKPGKRLIWPQVSLVPSSDFSDSSKTSNFIGHHEISDGEIRPMDFNDDLRFAAWGPSSRGDEIFIRVRRLSINQTEVFLDLRSEAGEEFESKVREAASSFYEKMSSENEKTLILFDGKTKKRIFGRKNALDALSLIEPVAESRAS